MSQIIHLLNNEKKSTEIFAVYNIRLVLEEC